MRYQVSMAGVRNALEAIKKAEFLEDLVTIEERCGDLFESKHPCAGLLHKELDEMFNELARKLR